MKRPNNIVTAYIYNDYLVTIIQLYVGEWIWIVSQPGRVVQTTKSRIARSELEAKAIAEKFIDLFTGLKSFMQPKPV